jgi:hypothetical protein
MDKERLASIKSRCSLMFFIQRIDSTRTKTILTEINERKGKVRVPHQWVAQVANQK